MKETVFVAEMTHQEYGERVADGNAVLMLPVGSLEQHGLHLSMNVDVVLPVAMCERVAPRVGAMVLPALQYGYKSQQKTGGGNFFVGTTSLDGATVSATLRDIIRELARHGVRRLVVVNGHYENSMFIVEGIDLALRELTHAGIEDFRVMTLSYWDFASEDEVIAALYPEGFKGWELEHGGIFETSLMLALDPRLVDMEKVVVHPPPGFPPYDLHPPRREWTPAPGTLSSAQDASAEKGRLILEVCTDGIANAVREEFLKTERPP